MYLTKQRVSPNLLFILFINEFGTRYALYLAVIKIKITNTVIKIILFTMDLDGEDIFPFNFYTLGRAWSQSMSGRLLVQRCNNLHF
jgi:hypothetical protein